ncbi:MAG TPA: hypothetical protein VMV92_44905 [Streptosporangiaceae bacterium]|nr:hypothetical protein [Streptosporangiaceae bacterium]
MDEATAAPPASVPPANVPGAGVSSPKVLRLDELPMAESRTAAYAILRDAGPVLRNARGAYLIVSSEAAEFALKHPGLFSSERAFDPVGSPLPLVPIAFDPPGHGRYRRILQPFFSPRGTASWLPKVHALAGQLIDEFAGRGHVASYDLGFPDGLACPVTGVQVIHRVAGC